MPSNPVSSRIEVVDALRGFAIFSIMLLHNIEHFDLYYFPQQLPAGLKTFDKAVWQTLFFLFSGKSYAVFALLFGFTFFIQTNNRAKKGYDFRLRFLWRLFLLLIFGMINTLFYQGDILSFYAVLGIILIPVSRWNNRAVLITAAILMLQPVEWFNVFRIISDPAYTAPVKLSDQYFAQTGRYMAQGSFPDIVRGNFTIGKPAVIYWSWENGRFFQTASLFMLGMLLGRIGGFYNNAKNRVLRNKVLLVSAISFISLFYIKQTINSTVANKALVEKLGAIVTSWSNFSFMLVLVSLFVYFYTKPQAQKLLNKLVPVGRMSLSNYIIQSMAGTFVYYGFGLALYKYTGATYCLFIGLLLFALQLWFCTQWFKRNKQGPLEQLWHRATWIFSSENHSKSPTVITAVVPETAEVPD